MHVGWRWPRYGYRKTLKNKTLSDMGGKGILESLASESSKGYKRETWYRTIKNW